ncbi:MAG: STAS domain-containing protein [Syntrophobacter sp.]
MHIDVKTSGETTFLEFEGECTIESAREMKAALVDALCNTNELILELAKVTAADLTLFQLICATHRATWNTNKRFSLGSGKSEAFSRLAEKAGYKRKIACHRDTVPQCLWTEAIMDGGQKG